MQLSLLLCLFAYFHVTAGSIGDFTITKIQYTNNVDGSFTIAGNVDLEITLDVIAAIPAYDANNNTAFISVQVPTDTDLTFRFGARGALTFPKIPGDGSSALNAGWQQKTGLAAPDKLPFPANLDFTHVQLLGTTTEDANCFGDNLLTPSGNCIQNLLPATGYVLKITDLTGPSICKPLAMTVTINGVARSFTPLGSDTFCPQLKDLVVTAIDSEYDATTSIKFGWTMDGLYDMSDLNEDIVFTFPTAAGNYAYTFDAGSSVVTDTGGSSYTFTPIVYGAVPGDSTTEYTPTLTVSSDGTGSTWTGGSTQELTITLARNPWWCQDGGEFCLTVFTYFSICTPMSGHVTACPVLESMSITNDPSRVGSVGGTTRVAFRVTDNDLKLSPVFDVTIQFPISRPDYLYTSPVAVAPVAPVIAISNLVMSQSQGTIKFTWDDTAFPNAKATQDVDFQLDLSGMGLPDGEDACDDYGYYNITIGPWTVAVDPTNEITGCPTLSNLNLMFDKPRYAAENVTAYFTVAVSDATLEPATIWFQWPAYAASGKTFQVKTLADNDWYMTIDGISNAAIALHRGQTYYFEVDAPFHFFAIMSTAATANGDCTAVATTGQNYTDGVTAPIYGSQVYGAGTLTWVVGWDAPNTLYWQDYQHPCMKGTITITDPPRGLQTTDYTTFGWGNGMLLENRTGTLFEGVTTPVDSGWFDPNPLNETMDYPCDTNDCTVTIRGFDDVTDTGSLSVPVGNRQLIITGLNLPTDAMCTDLGEMYLKVDHWSTTGNPVNDTYYCPTISNLDVTFANHVGGTTTTATITFDMEGADLPAPTWIAVVVNPDAGATFHTTANFGRISDNWVLAAAPTVRNIASLDVSVVGTVSSATVIPWMTTDQTENSTSIVIENFVLPSTCGDIGDWTLVLGDFRTTVNPPSDVVFCPEITNFDVGYSPLANHSHTVDATISFDLTDQVDPADIVLGVPKKIDLSEVTYSSVFLESMWTITGWGNDNIMDITINTTDSDVWNTIYIPISSGSRLNKLTKYSFTLYNITLPAADCEDLGDWYFSIGVTSTTTNPPGDSVTACPKMTTLDVDFSPDNEQGQSDVNATVSFMIEKYDLYFAIGQTNWIEITIPTTSGITFNSDAYIQSAMGGEWTLTTPSSVSDYKITQYFSAGGSLTAGNTYTVEIVGVDLPNDCNSVDAWTLAIGTWSTDLVPVEDVVVCPTIEQLTVAYTPSTYCTDAAEATVSFYVNQTRLRPDNSLFKFEFPASSGLDLYTWTYIKTTPGDWTRSSRTRLTDAERTETAGTQISYQWEFEGTPLEVGWYQFVVSAFKTPCNNCTDMGSYRFSVGKWTSGWINPNTDTLSCPGLLTGVSMSATPTSLPRVFATAQYMVTFMVHSFDWNEIRLEFPIGFQPGAAAAVTITESSSNLDASGATIWVKDDTFLYINGLTVSSTTSQWFSIKVNNIQVGNECEHSRFNVSTHHCTLTDRSGNQNGPIRYCKEGIMYNAYGEYQGADVMPQQCELCNACVKKYEVSGVDVYSCYENGHTIQRTVLSPTCTGAIVGDWPEF